jgi:hypothetical protein
MRMKRVGLVLLLIPLCPFVFGLECSKPAETVRHLPISRNACRKLQQEVSKGHQPWRLDSNAVAGEQILRIENVPRNNWDVYKVPFSVLKSTQDKAVLEYRSERYSGTEYLITLRKFDWLLPVAKKWNWVIWVPTIITTKRCVAPIKPGTPQSIR